MPAKKSAMRIPVGIRSTISEKPRKVGILKSILSEEKKKVLLKVRSPNPPGRPRFKGEGGKENG